MTRNPDLEQYKMREDHPNPQMRPSVDALSSKLRKLRVMQDPAVAKFIIEDLIHWYFVRENQRPDILFDLVMSCHHRWAMTLGMNVEKQIEWANQFDLLRLGREEEEASGADPYRV